MNEGGSRKEDFVAEKSRTYDVGAGKELPRGRTGIFIKVNAERHKMQQHPHSMLLSGVKQELLGRELAGKPSQSWFQIFSLVCFSTIGTSAGQQTGFLFQTRGLIWGSCLMKRVLECNGSPPLRRLDPIDSMSL